MNISADHLACDLTTFDSMAQRFGRVNRFGDRDDTEIHVVHPKEFDKKEEFDLQQRKTLELLRQLNGDGSPKALADLDTSARRDAFAPEPRILPVSDILFDAWALTTIRGKLPGRPMVEPYLHGVEDDKKSETSVAWREEVWQLWPKFNREEKGKERDVEESKRLEKLAADLLEDYPVKPHELLRDNSSRVYDRLKKLKSAEETPVWLISEDVSVEVTTIRELITAGKEKLNYKTLLLPPTVGGLENGMLTSNSETADDVADELYDAMGNRRRVRIWNDDPEFDSRSDGMRLVRRIDFPASGDDEGEEGRSWYWFELPTVGDTEGSKSNKKPVLWETHTDDVTNNATGYVAKLALPQELKNAIVLTARWHDLGKRRKLFQTTLGNFKYPDTVLAKSGKKGSRIPELYRHEFGSLVDVLDERQPWRVELCRLPADMQDVVLHLIAVHHGYGRPHFPTDLVFDPEPNGRNVDEIAVAATQRFARLQRRYGRWGLAYLESLLRAADYAASAKPSRFVEDEE